MIRAKVVKRDGYISIEARQHGRTDVCAAASMMLQATALGLRDLAKQWPKEIAFESDVYGSLNERSLDSTDSRRKKRRRR